MGRILGIAAIVLALAVAGLFWLNGSIDRSQPAAVKTEGPLAEVVTLTTQGDA